MSDLHDPVLVNPGSYVKWSESEYSFLISMTSGPIDPECIGNS